MRKLVVLDDNTTIIMLVRTKLSANGFEVLSAYNGETGLALIRESCPDLVLLDIMMPRMNGFEVFEAMKADELTKDIPVIFLTASGRREDEKRAMDMGAHSFLTKPFSPSNLLDIVNKVIQKNTPSHS